MRQPDQRLGGRGGQLLARRPRKKRLLQQGVHRPHRQKAADCAWNATIATFGPPPDPGCARQAIETSPQGKADLDEFVRKWTALQSTVPAGTVAANMKSLTPTDAEACDPSKALDDNFFPPISALDWTPTSPGEFKVSAVGFTLPGDMLFDATRHFTNALGANEGRLRAELRAAAKGADPVSMLCQSAKAFARDDTVLGRAYADLSVTGKRSFARFRTNPPTESNLTKCTGNARAIDSALNRAYNVANAIRFANSPDRHRLGWIAVSGEDDQPHRPVNVPSAEFPQYDLTVTVPVRGYNGLAPLPPITLTTRCVPADAKPVLDADAEVIVFIHGMDSRLEEALDLTHALHRIGAKSGKKYVIIAMDLPTSGYADNIDHLRIASLETIGLAKFRPVGSADVEITDLQIFDAGVGNNVPVVDFIEDFIVAFLNTLDAELPGMKLKVRAIVGGSLGGKHVHAPRSQSRQPVDQDRRALVPRRHLALVRGGRQRFHLPVVALAARRRTAGVQPAACLTRHQPASVYAEQYANAAGLRLRGHWRRSLREHAGSRMEDDQHAGEGHLPARHQALDSERAAQLGGGSDRRFSGGAVGTSSQA